MLYGKTSQFDLAAQDFSTAIAIDPLFHKAYFNMGTAYANMKQYKKAVEFYTKALSIDVNSVDAFNNRGKAYYDMGYHAEAIADFQTACSMGNEGSCQAAQEILTATGRKRDRPEIQ